MDEIKTYINNARDWVKDAVHSGCNGLIWILTQNKVLLLTLVVLYIFQETIADWIIVIVCPITSQVYINDIGVLLVIAVVIAGVYLIHIKRLWLEKKIFISRLWTLGLMYICYDIILKTGKFDFLGIKGWPYSYVDSAWLLIGVIEVLLVIKRFIAWCIRITKSDGYPFMLDTPAIKDEFNRMRYAEQLVKKIKSTTINVRNLEDEGISGAFTILLNEHYGVGKTSFMLQLQQIAEKEGVDVCWFKPWLYDENEMMMVNFVRVIQEKLGEGDGILNLMLHRYAQLLSSFKGYEVLSLLRWEKTSVESQFNAIKNQLYQKKRPIVVLIDDVDRLQSKELLRMLQMVRNMGDFPYLYYIVAGDKEAMMNRLREAEIAEPDEYLKKFFNLEVCFPAEDMQLAIILQNGLNEICRRYGIQASGIYHFISQLKYGSAIFATIRDVKRFFNELDFTLANLSANKMLDDVSMRDVAGVCMIQCIDSEFYRILRDHNEYVLEYAGWHLKVKKDIADVFADRSTKKMIYEAAMSIANDDGKPTNPLKEELDATVHSLQDLVKWSKPTKLEEIGELLEIMFPRSHAGDSKVAICHPTEYFKYFSTIYKETEMSNAEIIGIMHRDKASFVKEINKIIKDNKLNAFRHKLPWYFQTYEMPRVQAIEYVMEAFDVDWASTGERVPSFKEVSFLQNYGECLYSIFRERGAIGEFNREEEWKKISDWLINSTNYEHRILVFYVIAKHIEEYSMYIFKSREKVMQCVELSEKQYIEDVWSKQKFEPRLYSLIPAYYSIDTKIAEYVLGEIKKIKVIPTFLYHLLKYEQGELQWNIDYIESVLGSHLALVYEGSQWREVLPTKWEAEFLQFNMQAAIQKEDISRSDFLKSALRYWIRMSKTKKTIT